MECGATLPLERPDLSLHCYARSGDWKESRSVCGYQNSTHGTAAYKLSSLVPVQGVKLCAATVSCSNARMDQHDDIRTCNTHQLHAGPELSPTSPHISCCNSTLRSSLLPGMMKAAQQCSPTATSGCFGIHQAVSTPPTDLGMLAAPAGFPC